MNAQVRAQRDAPVGITRRLREAIDKGGGPSKVSRESGVPLSTLNDYMGGTDIKLSRGAAIADVCGISLDWLVFGDNVPRSRLPGVLPEFDDELLDKPAHFWGLYVLVRSAQFYFSKMDITPSLRDVLLWIKEPYRQALGTPDRPIELKAGTSPND